MLILSNSQIFICLPITSGTEAKGKFSLMFQVEHFSHLLESSWYSVSYSTNSEPASFRSPATTLADSFLVQWLFYLLSVYQYICQKSCMEVSLTIPIVYSYLLWHTLLAHAHTPYRLYGAHTQTHINTRIHTSDAKKVTPSLKLFIWLKNARRKKAARINFLQ